jgi:sialate O-acetylesterase
MKNPYRFIAVILAAFLVFSLAPVIHAEITLPSVIGDNMVLQQGKTIIIWGWADPNDQVTVSIGGNSSEASADENGAWTVRLPALKPAGPYSMKIASGSERIDLENILVGEVWVCSGQSNMEWQVQRSVNGEKEIAAAEYPEIRLFHIPRTTSHTPQQNVTAEWDVCSPETIRIFSAVGYFFGREINGELDVPVGLINTSWGGTRIEPWTPQEGFDAVPALQETRDEIDAADEKYRTDLENIIEPARNWAASAKNAVDGNSVIPEPPQLPRHALNHHQRPKGLYNSMIHPIVPFAIRGALWYQGEANRSEGMLYHEKMKALISGWRTVWDQGDFPFLFVQLAPYRYGDGNPEFLPKLWEAQTATLSVSNTGMAVTVDIGNVADIHPTNKQEVGRRLSLWALANTYGRDGITYSSPLYSSMNVEDNKIRISFDHAGSGLKSGDEEDLSWFTVAGNDRNFVKAKAAVDGKTVLVWSDSVNNPAAVRFAWDEIAEPNLVNSAGLPASSFRTDDWD